MSTKQSAPSPNPGGISKASYSITSTQQTLHYSPTGEECTSHVPGGGSCGLHQLSVYTPRPPSGHESVGGDSYNATPLVHAGEHLALHPVAMD